MSEPLYVPVLPARPHAVEAYRRLAPDVRAALMPLWNIPPLTAGTPAGLDAAVQRFVAPVSAAHRHHGGWIDAPFADGEQIRVLAGSLAVHSEWGRLLPVTGPERDEAQQTSALETGRRCGSGVGLRVRVPGEWDGGTAEAVRSLLTRAGPSVPVDLLLDMGEVLGDRPEADKEALRALDALVPLTAWRTAAVLGGGFPRVTADLLERGLREEPRTDWSMWHGMRTSGRAYLPLLGYGDYGVQHTGALAQVPRPNSGGGPPWGALRYTTESSYVLCKVLNRGDDRIAVNRRAARWITELPGFRARGGAGEAWLRGCADGPLTSPKGTGGPLQWLWAGHTQHLTYVARCLSGGRTGR
ncbi:beta family protein [Streptomyces pactum]|uniref:Beta family protein n=1 Tax=Streptomyces pactum TaxID=68249 RepID=A0ABS0NQE1_9ACTN|nr:beta family protein [Streptomyces pactum]MBH5337425.1 beta family protein [Streptomyces pactum]